MPAIDAAVTAALAAAKIHYQTAYAGEVRKWGQPMDAWKVTFTRGARTASFPYYMGLGHRTQVKPMPVPRYTRGTLAYDAWSKTAFTPTAPTAASVLHSLMLDASAREMPFASWCREYGYSTDSRKALTTYEDCQQYGDALAAVLHETWSAVAALVEGY